MHRGQSDSRALAVTYSNAVLDFMIASTVKGKRLDLCQVLVTYSPGPNNNHELKNKKADFWSPEHSLISLRTEDIIDAHFNAPLL